MIQLMNPGRCQQSSKPDHYHVCTMHVNTTSVAIFFYHVWLWFDTYFEHCEVTTQKNARKDSDATDNNHQ